MWRSWKEKEAPVPLGKAQFPFVGNVLVSGVLCLLEDVEGLNGGSVAVPRIGWDSDNCLRLPTPGSAAVPHHRDVGHTSQLAQLLCAQSGFWGSSRIKVIWVGRGNQLCGTHVVFICPSLLVAQGW